MKNMLEEFKAFMQKGDVVTIAVVHIERDFTGGLGHTNTNVHVRNGSGMGPESTPNGTTGSSASVS